MALLKAWSKPTEEAPAASAGATAGHAKPGDNAGCEADKVVQMYVSTLIDGRFIQRFSHGDVAEQAKDCQDIIRKLVAEDIVPDFSVREVITGIVKSLCAREPVFRVKLRRWTGDLLQASLPENPSYESLIRFLDIVYATALGMTVAPLGVPPRASTAGEPEPREGRGTNASAGPGSARGSTPRAWCNGSQDSAEHHQERRRETKKEYSVRVNKQLLGVMNMGGEEEASEDKIERILRVVAHLRGDDTPSVHEPDPDWTGSGQTLMSDDESSASQRAERTRYDTRLTGDTERRRVEIERILPQEYDEQEVSSEVSAQYM